MFATNLILTILGSLGVVLGSFQTPLLRHDDDPGRTVSNALFAELEELARIVDISYCVGLTSFGISKPFSCLSRCSDFPLFELVRTWNTGPLLADSCGYIALDHDKKRIILAFRGTYSIANAIVDLSTVPQEYVPYPGSGDEEMTVNVLSTQARCTNCTVHMGFYRSWQVTRKEILPALQQQLLLYPGYNLSLVGHSLGGAVAALAGLDFKARGWHPTITTFGEPRIGNAALSRYIDGTFGIGNGTSTTIDDTQLQFRRVTHVDDPVPLLPLTEWGFSMHAGEIYISKSNLSPEVADLAHCTGDNDADCIAGQDATASSLQGKAGLLDSVKDEIHDIGTESWGIPSRYKLWELLFAHRDYFWRLGLCVPGGDPLGGGGGKYRYRKDDL
ncbi:related to triacylglycerol lipase [Ramularia collo-cygni]|uniref:Related to triacylglycerol lipase n=1 Tax=Ramularia collo-cygni TaxID=112498 RepID=A0A2D3UUW2_9PEZI|nr:related to triacylglycerol lipase [Ramularia collo-cygni]CZT17915.1 related to triacylglycerol lipase [Ramularia collo-cygni]